MDTTTRSEEALHADGVRWRHDFHRFPETGFNEHRTADRIAQGLQLLGLDVHRGIGGSARRTARAAPGVYAEQVGRSAEAVSAAQQAWSDSTSRHNRALLPQDALSGPHVICSRT